MSSLKHLAAALALLAAGTGAAAAQSTANFQVRITIQESCAFSSTTPTDVDFSSIDRSQSAADAAGNLVVDCTVGTPYTIALDAGQHATSVTASADNRRMALSGQYVPYGLYRESTRTQFWGDTAGSNAYSGTGDGVGQSVPVYGRVPDGGTNVPAGTYTDQITATLTF